MKYFLIFTLCLFLNHSIYCQEEIGTKEAQQEEHVQPIDTLGIQDTISGLTARIVGSKEKDSLVFELGDLPIAKEKDSLWLQELYNSELFEEVYGTITTQEYEEIEYEELPTELLKERLSELNARTPFNVEYNPSLESVIKQYLKNRRKTMGRLMALSDYYFPMFEEALDKHNLPLEIKYLAIVESALNPRARSRVGATGLWQFMYNTGKLFGLNVSSYVDERSDPIMATEAACKYLTSLYNSLGDWDLALAAYNSGPGNVSKAIRRSGGYKNYWNIRHHLPRETAGYVPAFLATMYIFEYAEEHGFKSSGETIPHIATDTIRIKKMISLEQAARVTNSSLEEIQFLNPSYKLDLIPVVKDKDYTLRLPVEALGKFIANEDNIYDYAEKEFNSREKPLPQYLEMGNRIRYKVKSGDYLGKIAGRYGVTISQIKRWNGLRSNNLRIGQRLSIYPRKFVEDNSKPVVSTEGSTKIYTVKNGDSLWSISQKFPGVSVQNIKKWNDISGDKLKPGMKLKVSKG